MLIADTVVHPFPSPPCSKDVLRVDRAIGDPEYADHSNFLHPVFYHYKEPPNPGTGSNTPLIPLHIQSSICSPLLPLLNHNHLLPESVWVSGSLPHPNLYHHIVEDFLTDWWDCNINWFSMIQFNVMSFLASQCIVPVLSSSSNVLTWLHSPPHWNMIFWGT